MAYMNKKLSSRFGTYIQKDGKVYNRIGNFWKLSADMMLELGKDWKQKSISTYGPEQLFENQYDSKGRQI